MNPVLSKCVAFTALCLVLTSCAQIGPPVPPSLELPKAPTDLRASRKGSHVTLTWTEPTLTSDRQSVRFIGPTLICRSLDPVIATCTETVGTLPAPSSPPQKGPSARPITLTYMDPLPASLEQNPAADITYAVEVLNRNARGGGLSNRVHVPAVITLSAPNNLFAELTDNGVVLKWTSPADLQAILSSPTQTAGVQFRYRIYRHNESGGKDAIVAELPIAETGAKNFVDTSFEWERTYFYRVTTVSVVKPAGREVQVEGDDSPTVRVVTHDIFPPAVPSGLQAAFSGEGQKPFIDLVWSPATNSDLAGYNVYRRESTAVNTTMVRLNAEPVKSSSYRDSAIASGKTYIYSVSSADVRGNESQKSEEASESVP